MNVHKRFLESMPCSASSFMVLCIRCSEPCWLKQKRVFQSPRFYYFITNSYSTALPFSNYYVGLNMGNTMVSRNVCISSCSAVFWCWWSVCRCVPAHSSRHAGEHWGDRVRHPDAELWSDDCRPYLLHPHSHAHRREVGVGVFLWKSLRSQRNLAKCRKG